MNLFLLYTYTIHSNYTQQQQQQQHEQ